MIRKERSELFKTVNLLGCDRALNCAISSLLGFREWHPVKARIIGVVGVRVVNIDEECAFLASSHILVELEERRQHRAREMIARDDIYVRRRMREHS